MYTVRPLIVSICGILVSDTQGPIKAMAIRRVDLECGILNGRERRTKEARDTIHLYHRLSFVLQQALSQLSQHYLC